MTNAARNSAKTLATLQLVLGEIEEFLIQEGHTHLYDVVCTRPDRIEPATSIARHSRVYSSITVKHFNCCPLAHASNTKSYAQTCRADVAGWGGPMHGYAPTWTFAWRLQASFHSGQLSRLRYACLCLWAADENVNRA